MADTHQNNAPKRKKALGRGLSALIPSTASGTATADITAREYFECDLDKIDPATIQPRKHFDPDALQELSDSIRESGLIQPLVVRRKAGRFELIAGERRWRASRMAGLKAVPVVVKDVSDSIAFALALIENIQRQDLNPIEEALAYRRLLDDFEFTQADLAEQVGKSRSAVANSVRLLSLPDSVLTMVAESSLTPGHARTLIGLEAQDAELAAERIYDEQLTVRQTEQLARAIKNDTPLPTFEATETAEVPASSEPPVASELPKETVQFESTPHRDDDATRALTSSLARALGLEVRLKDQHGSGRLELHYGSYDELERALEVLGIDVTLDDPAR